MVPAVVLQGLPGFFRKLDRKLDAFRGRYGHRSWSLDGLGNLGRLNGADVHPACTTGSLRRSERSLDYIGGKPLVLSRARKCIRKCRLEISAHSCLHLAVEFVGVKNGGQGFDFRLGELVAALGNSKAREHRIAVLFPVADENR